MCFIIKEKKKLKFPKKIGVKIRAREAFVEEEENKEKKKEISEQEEEGEINSGEKKRKILNENDELMEMINEKVKHRQGHQERKRKKEKTNPNDDSKREDASRDLNEETSEKERWKELNRNDTMGELGLNLAEKKEKDEDDIIIKSVSHIPLLVSGDDNNATVSLPFFNLR
jgi:hypothetical protein